MSDQISHLSLQAGYTNTLQLFSVSAIFLSTKKWQRNTQKSKLFLSKSLLRHQSIIKDSTPVADYIPGTQELPLRQKTECHNPWLRKEKQMAIIKCTNFMDYKDSFLLSFQETNSLATEAETNL